MNGVYRNNNCFCISEPYETHKNTTKAKYKIFNVKEDGTNSTHWALNG
jgi:hypothetical protein